MELLTQRAVVFGLLVLVFAACDPGREISASKPIPAPLNKTCVIEALRMQHTVRDAGVGPSGLTYATLMIPEPLTSPEAHPEVSVDEIRNDKGELAIRLEMVWVGSKGSPEYLTYAQKTIEELRDRIIEKCSDK